MRNRTAAVSLFAWMCAACSSSSDPVADSLDGGAITDAATPVDGTVEPTNDAGAVDGGREPPSGEGAWTTGTAARTSRSELAVAELDGRIYVAGGFGGLSVFEAYEVATGEWTTLRDLPADRDHPSLAALRGRIHLMGGRSSETFAYDPAMDEWEPRASLVLERYAAAAVTLSDAIYLVGGTGPNERVMQRYDPDEDRWMERASLSAVRDHVAAVVLEGEIYVLGGRPGLGALRTVEIYDPIANAFRPGPSMRDVRSGFGAAVIDGRIYAAGGEVLELPNFYASNTAEVFDPRTGEWSYVAPLPTPLHGFGAAAYGDRLYVFGGASAPASATPRPDQVYVFDPWGS